MERSYTKDLIKWKRRRNKNPLIINGIRGVGKTYLVNDFGTKNYEHLFAVDFESDETLKHLITEDITLESLLKIFSEYNSSVSLIPKKTLIFLDEIFACPNILHIIELLSFTGKFDVIATRSMPSNYEIPNAYKLFIRPMSFIEFLTEKQVIQDIYEEIFNCFRNEIDLNMRHHNLLSRCFIEYILVGGMPEVVSLFLETNDLILVKKLQLELYKKLKDDIVKYTDKYIGRNSLLILESIPKQLSNRYKKFQYKYLGARNRKRKNTLGLDNIIDFGIVNKVYRLDTFDLPLEPFGNGSCYKLYFIDTGLFSALQSDALRNALFHNRIGVLNCGLLENVLSQILITDGFEIFFYRRDNKLEMPLVTTIKKDIIPIEYRNYKKRTSNILKNLVESEVLEYGVNLTLWNENPYKYRTKTYPIYFVMFLKYLKEVIK